MGLAPRPIPLKRQDELDGEWDLVAEARFEQLRRGQDLTYREVLIPLIFDLAKIHSSDTVVDAGCGVGS